MPGPLTSVLVKIFARGFYREHGGFLIFLFVNVVSYCFYIQILNDIIPEQSTFFHLLVVLTFISSPGMMVVIFIVWLIYSIKSWTYVTAQLRNPAHQFLHYSITSMSPVQLFKSWFIVQTVISLPIIVYVLFSIITGIIFNHYIIPAVSTCYVLLLFIVSAFLYVNKLNTLQDVYQQPSIIRLTRKWRKPLFILFVCHLADKLKLAYVLTKVLSFSIIVGFNYLIPHEMHDLRSSGLAILVIVVAHTVLIYYSHLFENRYLSFLRNFPYRRSGLLLNFALLYSLLILPEIVWTFFAFQLDVSIGLFLFALSTSILFRMILYVLGTRMAQYVQWIFGLFMIFFIIVMFRLLWPLIFLSLVVSAKIFYRNYYKQ